MTLQVFPAGSNALLIELEEGVSAGRVRAAAAAAWKLPELESCVVGHSSLYLTFFGALPSATDLEALESATERTHTATTQHVVPVSFADEDAPDLPELLRASGLTRPRFLEQISSLIFTARYLGFRPGFAYLEGLPTAWQLPRRERPRTNVPEGSLGIAGTMTAFYPLRTPGGWNLIGRTSERLWDETKPRPNLIAAGDEVRMQPSDLTFEEPEAPRRVEPAREGVHIADTAAAGQMTLLVRSPDAGRIVSGMPAGGPFDEQAARAANRAVGNLGSEAVLECTLVGPALRFHRDAVLSWYGADAEISLDGDPVRERRQFNVASGQLLSIGRLIDGARGVLAIEGGWVADASQFALRPEVLVRGRTLRAFSRGASLARIAAPGRPQRCSINALPGPHAIDHSRLREIVADTWEVHAASDRVGIRLHSSSRHAAPEADLHSCGMQFGTVQWHPNGELVVMGPDHPITGGYLQVLTVIKSERWKLAQLSAGDQVRWVVGPERV